MSGSTRAAAAANSRRVKQRLVNMLFLGKYTKQGRGAHRKLDFAAYSYDDLRQAYFEKIHLLHPDKSWSERFASSEKHDPNIPNNSSEKKLRSLKESIQRHKAKSDKEEFIDLKDAWEDYHTLAHAMKRGYKSSTRGMNYDFTMFGVGCSFADSPSEQRRRSDIMDQACRGWLSAGKLKGGCNDEIKAHDDIKKSPIWSTDSKPDQELNEEESSLRRKCYKKPSRQKSLVDHLLRKQRST